MYTDQIIGQSLHGSFTYRMKVPSPLNEIYIISRFDLIDMLIRLIMQNAQHLHLSIRQCLYLEDK